MISEITTILCQTVSGWLTSQNTDTNPNQYKYKQEIQTAKEKIDPTTGLGPDSTDMVVGTRNTSAPQCMQLKNDEIMVRRGGQKAVLHLQYSGKTSKHGNQLLWSCWQHLEEVTGVQAEEETAEQRSIRLEIFPKSVFQQDDDDI